MRYILITSLILSGCLGRFNLKTVDTRKCTPDIVASLVKEGYEVDSHTVDSARTRPSIIYLNDRRKSIEFQLWYQVRGSKVSVYCTQRELPVWSFRECTHSVILDLIDYDLDVVRGMEWM